MELLGLESGRKPRVVTAMTMLKQMLFRYDFSLFRIGGCMGLLTTLFLGIKDKLVLRWCWVGLMRLDRIYSRSIPMAPLTSFHM